MIPRIFLSVSVFAESQPSRILYVGAIETSLLAAESNGLLPDSTEKDPDQGQFANFHDPDGNEVTIWGGKI